MTVFLAFLIILINTCIIASTKLSTLCSNVEYYASDEVNNATCGKIYFTDYLKFETDIKIIFDRNVLYATINDRKIGDFFRKILFVRFNSKNEAKVLRFCAEAEDSSQVTVVDVDVNGKTQCLRRKAKQDDTDCGSLAKNIPFPLINHGYSVSITQYPWHAALYHYIKSDYLYQCGGSLVSMQHVLTAGHCVLRYRVVLKTLDPKDVLVYLGLERRNGTNDTSVQVFSVTEINLHPHFNLSNFHNDLALIKLDRRVMVTDYVRPVCLWTDNEYWNIENRTGNVVGWGMSQHGRFSNYLQQITLPVAPKETCLYSNPNFYPRFSSENSFCAGYRNGTSVCNGDSGGGMVFSKRDPFGRVVWQLRGLVSLSVFEEQFWTCDVYQYVIFTDVAKYAAWIAANTKLEDVNLVSYFGVSDDDQDASCGKMPALNTRSALVAEGEFPWNGRLHNGTKFLGHATLVSPNHAVTVADLVADYTAADLQLHFPGHFLTRAEETRQTQAMVVHPDYDRRINQANLALLRLNASVDAFNPVCLWTGGKDGLAAVPGWGVHNASYDYVKFYPEVVPRCSLLYADTVSRTYCATRTSCMVAGGSGMVFARSNVWQLRGLLSRGYNSFVNGACHETRHSVYTDLANYTRWMRDLIDLERWPVNRNGKIPYCGVIVDGPRPNPYDGSLAFRGQFPWHGDLYSGKRYLGIANLVSLKHAVTLGEFLLDRFPYEFSVAFRTHFVDDPEQKRLVNFMGVHADGSVGVVRFSVPVDYNAYVRPVCLWRGDPDVRRIAGERGTVPGRYALYNSLHKFHHRVVGRCAAGGGGNEICAAPRNHSNIFDQTCVSFGTGIVFRRRNARVPVWQLRGLYNGNSSRCDSARGAVFTDLAAYAAWIRRFMGRWP